MMRRFFEIMGELTLAGFGCIGLVNLIAIPFAASVALTTVGGLLVALRLLSFTFDKPNHYWPTDQTQPQALQLGAKDYAKALIAWLLGFRRTYAVEPGLYYTGTHYDQDTPLLVTSNYHLTVFLVVRRVQAFNARILVIDTDGINVWCAAGKGRFGNKEIIKQLDRVPRQILSTESRVRLILPKFGMSGTNLRQLRDYGIRPIVGPLYAKDLPDYLRSRPYQNRNQDRVVFGLPSRTFIWLPGVLQMTALSTIVAVLIWTITFPFKPLCPLSIIGITAILTTVYAFFFPLIPARRFAVKGLWLGLLMSCILFAEALMEGYTPWHLGYIIPFTVALSILIGLEFTGNSAVSNYSSVKREMAVFLPIVALLVFVSAGAFFMTEVIL